MNYGAETGEKPRKKRKIWMKKGGYKYLLQLLHPHQTRIRELRKTQRYMIQGLKHTFSLTKNISSPSPAERGVDQEILAVLYRAGPPGKLPRDVAAELAEYKLKPYSVTRRIRCMNKCLDRYIAKALAEKRRLKWSLTNWGATQEEM